MSPRPAIGLIIPTFGRDRIPDTAELLAFCRRAEELGFHSLWVIDRVLHRDAQMAHALTMLAYAAAVTKKIKLGAGVIMLPSRRVAMHVEKSCD